MTADVTFEGEQRFGPTEALVIYGSGYERIATHHRIECDGRSAPVLQAGVPLTVQTLRMISTSLSGRSLNRRLLDPGILFAAYDLVIWWRPAQHRAVFFDTGSAIDEINGKIALHPPLLFHASAQGLRVFALDENKRPTEDSPLYRAPYYNLYEDGLMCSGNVPIPRLPDSDCDTIENYERAFFVSSFAHTNMKGGKLTTIPGGHSMLWRGLVATQHSFFPFHALVGLGKTLGKLVES